MLAFYRHAARPDADVLRASWIASPRYWAQCDSTQTEESHDLS
jgi:hypothetical protein